jgi:hypothetical protein
MKTLSMENTQKFVLLIALFASGIIFSQNENDAVWLAVPGIISNARALGMGNSYSTRSGDYSAMIFNPAGLALSQHSQLTGSFYHRFYENNSNFFGNESYYKNSATKFIRFDSIECTCGIKLCRRGTHPAPVPF